MKTIKLPYKSEYNFHELMRQYSCIVRFAYNRILDSKSQKDIRLLVKSLNGINLMNSWMIQSAINEAQGIIEKNGKEKVIFGGKNNLYNFLKGKISKDKYKENKLIPLNLIGEMLQKGNRMFNLDIIKNNKIIFKLNKEIKIDIFLPDIKKNYKNQLYLLETRNMVKQGELGYTYSVKIGKEFIFMVFEEIKNKEILNLSEKYCGIDLNPEYIGLSIFKEDKLQDKRCYSLKRLTIKSGKSSSHKKSKYLQNKLRHETIEIVKDIFSYIKQNQIKYVFIENLKFKNKNTQNNRLNKNKWLKTLFIEQLEKRIRTTNIELYRINPCYSSVIGNLQHDYFDPINASIEVSRRGYNTKILKNDKFYPEFKVKESISHQWKEMGIDSFNDWKEVFTFLKNSKMRYRVSLSDQKFNVFKTEKSLVGFY